VEVFDNQYLVFCRVIGENLEIFSKTENYYEYKTKIFLELEKIKKILNEMKINHNDFFYDGEFILKNICINFISEEEFRLYIIDWDYDTVYNK
jgi:thiamine kinase-like enzyme